MSGFNAFLGGASSGHAAFQNRQSAFNEAVALGPPQGGQPSGGSVGGGAPHPPYNIFTGLDTAQRQEVKAELARKGRIVAALSALPVDQQAIGIQTYGKDFGIDAARLKRAAAEPSSALATFSSSLQQAEAMLERSRPDARQNIGQNIGEGNNWRYRNSRGLGNAETPVTLVAQVADGQSTAADPYARAVPEPQIPVSPSEPIGSLSQNNNRDISSNPLGGEDQLYGVDDISETVAREADASFDIGNIAKGAEEAYDGGYGEGYSYAQPQGRFGANTNKCNLFVSDMVKAAGATVPFNMDKKTGFAWEPRAEQWADPTIPMEGWIVVKTPQKGDVVAQKRGYQNNASASGHVGIVTRDADEQGYYRTISAGTEGVQEESSALSFPSFMPNVELGPVIFRRYVGK